MTDNNLHFDELYNLIVKADDGNSKAMNTLHNYYCLEKYTQDDFKIEFIELLTERANQNKPYSLLQLSLIYLLGLGVERDFDKCTELLIKSINVNCSCAYYVMAMLVLADQIEYAMDYDELLSKAMDLGNSAAFIQKGVECSETDFEQSLELYKKAIDMDNDYAIYKLGELYHDNNKYKLAIEYYNQAINKNVHHAHFNLAVMYREGEGVDIDLDKAKKLFKEAMSLGNIKAITCIGGLYEQCNNLKKAKKYYKMAIVEDDTFAKYNLGLIYETEKKYKKAIKCLIESAKDGHQSSGHQLIYDYNVTNLDMTDSEIDELLNFHYAFKDFGAYDGFLSR